MGSVTEKTPELLKAKAPGSWGPPENLIFLWFKNSPEGIRVLGVHKIGPRKHSALYKAACHFIPLAPAFTVANHSLLGIFRDTVKYHLPT